MESALVVDIHEATISIEEHSNTTDGDIVFEIGASHVLVACSPGTASFRHNERYTGQVDLYALYPIQPWPVETGETLDNLQYWIMDAAHLLNSAMDDDWEASREDDEEPEQPTLSRVLAQIGRCFFARGEDEDANEVVVENVVKISAEDMYSAKLNRLALIRVLVPISNQEGRTIAVRVVDVTATSADALVAYEGDDTLVDLDVKRVTVENRVSSTFSETILSVMPLNSTLPKATIKMRFADPRTRSMDMESGANDIDSPS
ncbi:autophagy-related protein 2 [Paramarasmius palmivorus]|uniref:Autophagy-related protein 2 n=1 Tax=Paramarasmius palmivorus TaxID=297713 RepID=A0AAW0DUK5_9AGAR